MKLTITEKHLDAALARPWSPRTCLAAQAFTELGEVSHCSTHDATMANGRRYYAFDTDRVIRGLQIDFDAAHGMLTDRPEAVIRKAAAVAAIRANLPVTVEIPD